MKKYMGLLLGSGLMIALIFGVKALTKPTETVVTLWCAEPKTVQRTVTCVGKVEASNSRAVYVEMPCVTKEVYVKAGQYVDQGEPLFSVDAEATKQALSQIAGSLSGEMMIDDSDVTAPVSGVVSAVGVRAGEVADHTQPCVTIAAGDGVQITASVRERHLPQVQIGQKVIVTGVAFEKQQYLGTVTELAPSAHQQYIGSVSETVVDAVIVLDDGMTDASLRSGLNAEAEIVTQVVENALLIPYTCITQNDKGEEFVYVYRGNGVAERQPIETSAEYADGVLVVSGISAGEWLVQAADTLSGARVNVRTE